MKYIIYMAQNIENGDVYIGATKNSVEQRKMDHLERAHRGESGKFHEAISTYGAEAFLWEQIDTANSTDELAQKEKAYILSYNAKEDGYNSDEGGGFKKTVYQYNIEDGTLAGSFDCLQNAGNAINATKQQLSKACLSVNKTFAGFYWSYDYIEPFQPEIDKRRKKVNQYDLEGTYINSFRSIAEASRFTGIYKSSIAKVCRGERGSAGGYFWEYQ